MIFDDLEAIIAAHSIEELWAHLPARMAEFGFDRVIYGFTRFRRANSFGDPRDLLILSNHSAEYIDPFIKDGLYFDAPMVRWSAGHVGTCSWRWVKERAEAGELTEGEKKVLTFNKKHGVTAGYSISFTELSSRAKGAVGLSARGRSQDEVDEIWARHGREINVLWNVAHLKLINLPYNPGGRALTPRQREALEWVGEGKTTVDIATIMGLTPATVEKHLRLAREALDVETTAQAVLKAAVHNQIFRVEA
ncbi:MAG: LuxR family transcriptional regulator [Paracoccaceae bacterium]